MSMTHKVRITETLVKVVSVEAELIEDAINIVIDNYDSQDIVLSADDFLDVEFDKEEEDDSNITFNER